MVIHITGLEVVLSPPSSNNKKFLEFIKPDSKCMYLYSINKKHLLHTDGGIYYEKINYVLYFSNTLT